MAQTLHSVGTWLVHDLGWISLEVLVLTGIVYIVTRRGGIKSSRVKRWLWTLVVVKPLVSLLIGWPIPLGMGRDAPVAPIAERAADRVANVPSLDEAILPADVLTQAALPPAPVVEPVETAPPLLNRAGQGGVTGFAVLGALWLAGCIGMFGYAVIGAVWLTRTKMQAVPIDAEDLLASVEQYHDALEKLLRRVHVRLTTRIAEPCIYGFFRPVILLPTWCLDDNTPPNLEYILLHEGTHARAGDHWFLWLRRAMETFLWFHPAVWYAGKQAMAQAENVCDEAVVSLAQREGTASAALMYSSCLMRVLERATRHAFEGLVPGVIPTAERIRRLVQQTGSFATSVSRWAVVGVVALGALTLPGAFNGRSALATKAYAMAKGEAPPVREILYATRYPGDYFRNLYIMRSDGSRPQRLTDDTSFYMESAWSPDGSRIAAVTMRPGAPGWRVYMHDASGGVMHALGDAEWSLRDPEWSPDGTRLLCSGQAPTDTVGNIYLLDADGPIIRRLTDDTMESRVAVWSPDTSRIALIRRRIGHVGLELAIMESDGTRARVAPGSDALGVLATRPAWSPDGRRLAYMSKGATDEDPRELRLLHLDGMTSTTLGELSPIQGPGRRRLDWFPDENALLVVDRRKGDTRYQTYQLALDTGSMTRLSPGFEEAVMASVGPVADHGREGGALVRAPLAMGPVRHPVTGHIYYAVIAARRLTWPQAKAAAGAMRHEGRAGYLASVTSEDENRFLLLELPLARHGCWMGGYGDPTGGAGASFSWQWDHGERWEYAAWIRGEPRTSNEWNARAVTTRDLYAQEPERAGTQEHYGWHPQDPWEHQLGFIVEFDAPKVSALPSGPSDPPSSRF
ncbi:hypothetical protein HN371_05215 [Candidatus Poribacteria bacterium]|jgi:beta-lactamase regulating signal transducer with metallopeptidase domain|nr:hypothetical protein [Candidatus Poribacteria bacterium]MBT5536444.1 hypothetical protein [Candidatus Poribacteria bacterium]MBT7098452.1 hypothetical protein [Candidatus Poribacteria bacterium]